MGFFDKILRATPEGYLAGAVMDSNKSSRAERKQQKLNDKLKKAQLKSEMRASNKEIWKYRAHKFMWFIAIFFIIVLLIIFVSNSYLRAKAEVPLETAVVEVEDVSKDKLSAPLGIVSQLVQGTYDPTYLWSSQQVKSQYSDISDDFGVKIKGVKPMRGELFYPGEKITIVGDLTVVGADSLQPTIPFNVKASSRCSIIAEGLRGLISSIPSLDVDKDYCDIGWNCYVTLGGTYVEVPTKIKRAFNQEVICQSPIVSYVDSETSESVKMTWEYSTSAVAAKQVFVMNPVTLAQFERPEDHFNIPEDSFEAWSISEGNVEVGIGVNDNRGKFVKTFSSEDKYIPMNYIGVSIKNKGSGEITNINNIKITVPNNKDIRIYTTAQGSINDFVANATYFIPDTNFELKEYVLSSNGKSKVTPSNPLSSSEHESYFLGFLVSDDYLRGAQFQEFLVKVEVSYDYKDEDSTTVVIKPTPLSNEAIVNEDFGL